MAFRSSSGQAHRRVASRDEILAQLEGLLHRGEGVLVIMVKVTGMKSFNHAHGVRAGDQMLEEVGTRIAEHISPQDMAGKMRGDVFLIVRPNASIDMAESSVGEAAHTLADRLRGDHADFEPRVAIGIAHARPGEGDIDDLLTTAGAAMRAARASNTVIVRADDQLRTDAHIESVIDRDIAEAIEAGTLQCAYQPIVTLADGRVHGAEALLRWEHEELGPMNPAVVIERIDAIGLTKKLTQWSVDRIAYEWSTLLNEQPSFEGMSVSVNLNQAQLADPECATIVREARERYGLSPHSMLIEVVESGPVGLGEAATTTLRQMAEDGSLIMLDDFGTGFNALECFLKFPVHGIKFDQSLVHSIAENTTARVIVRGVSQIAAELGVATVAEGVETKSDADTCRNLDLTFGQGWHFGRPAPLAMFADFAESNREVVSGRSLHRPSFAESGNRLTEKVGDLEQNMDQFREWLVDPASADRLGFRTGPSLEQQV